MSFIRRILDLILGLFKRSPAPVQIPASAPTSTERRVTLAWEKDHPERGEWSEALYDLVDKSLAKLDLADDMSRFVPSYMALKREDRIRAWCDLFCAMAFYESGWNPGESSVDVGQVDDIDSYSVGLLQMSVCDQANYKLTLGYHFLDLKDPIKNLTLAVTIMAIMVSRKRKILIPKGEGAYWAVIIPNGKYQKIDAIKAMVQARQTATSEPKWLTIARGEVGVTETKNPKRVIEYHSATTLAAKDVKTAWCSSFVNWCMKQAGITGTRSAWARDWLQWGLELNEPVVGCVAVYERNAPGGDSHAALWLGHEGPYDRVINGNIGDSVCYSLQPKAKLLGYRWPKGGV